MNLEDKIQELSQAIDNLKQELNTPKEGDWYMVLDIFEKEDNLGKRAYVPGDIFKVHKIEKSTVLTSKIWLYNKSINPIGLGGCRKLSESEVLKHLADKAGIKIGSFYKLGTYRCPHWGAGVWDRDFYNNDYIVQGFCFEEGFPCVYTNYTRYKLVTKMEDLIPESKKEATIVIGTNKAKIRISKLGIYDQYSAKTTIKELKALIDPSNPFSTGAYAVSVNTIDIGCIKGITRGEIENIIQIARKLELN